ncbi:hypothetical protein NQZ68_018612 [Dissostichus eleginoides]|nr:hypothetical protein NQZ68_018612 [Dissostichus eleginoides]
MDRAAVGSPCRTPSAPVCNISTSTLAFDQHFTTTATGKLHLAEIITEEKRQDGLSVNTVWLAAMQRLGRPH